MTAHTRTQIARFVRLFVVVLAAQAVGLDLTHLGRSALVSLFVASFEVAWRQFRPAVPAPVTRKKASLASKKASPNERYIRGRLVDQARRAERADDHDYLSTACFHGEHGRCRHTCKFCPADCRCACHG